MKKTTYGAIRTLLMLLWAFQAHAGFSVAPLRFEFQLEKGKSGTASINVNNNGDEPVSVKIYQNDFMVDQINQDIILPPGENKRGCAAWMSISPLTLDLGPKEQKKVRISLTVPEHARGTYWAFVFIEQASKPRPVMQSKQGHNISINVKPRWGVRIHENVPGTEHKEGRITDINVTHQTPENPVKVSVEFENTGNTLLHCDGRVEIRDAEGKDIETLKIGSKGRFGVYPSGKRLVNGTLSRNLSPGDYIALAIVDYAGEELVAGELEFEVK